jgi:hypothetical protein
MGRLKLERRRRLRASSQGHENHIGEILRIMKHRHQKRHIPRNKDKWPRHLLNAVIIGGMIGSVWLKRLEVIEERYGSAPSQDFYYV